MLSRENTVVVLALLLKPIQVSFLNFVLAHRADERFLFSMQDVERVQNDQDGNLRCFFSG